MTKPLAHRATAIFAAFVAIWIGCSAEAPPAPDPQADRRSTDLDEDLTLSSTPPRTPYPGDCPNCLENCECSGDANSCVRNCGAGHDANSCLHDCSAGHDLGKCLDHCTAGHDANACTSQCSAVHDCNSCVGSTCTCYHR